MAFCALMDSCGKLRRLIDVRTTASVVIASMMGAGIFTTGGYIARDTGSPSIVLALWVVGGAIALAGALSYAELGAAMPRREANTFICVRRMDPW